MKSGWVTKKLGDVCEDSIRRLKEIDDSRFLYIDISSIDRVRKSIVGAAEYERIKAPGRAQQVVEAGDVLVSTVRPNLNAVAIVEGESDFQRIASTGFCVLRAGECVIPRYIYYFTQVDEFIAPLVAVSEKAAYPSVTDKVVKSVDIPIPPLAEQKRIVAKIDAAFEKIDALKANAEKNLANAKELFQSALDEAMRPKKGWVEKRLGEVYEITSSKRVFKSEWQASGVPFYRAREIVKLAATGMVRNELFISEEMYEKYAKTYGIPHANDIMITGVGTLGICYVVKEKDKFYFKDGNIIWLKKRSDEVYSDFVALAFQTDSVRKQVTANMGTTVGTYTIIMAKNTVVRLPLLIEQQKIVENIQDFKNKLETLQDNYARQIEDCIEMRQAILREAFEGRL